jgi:hypothetical protein
MTTNEFADEKLREVISKLEFGEYERNATACTEIPGQFNIPTIHASITYKFENGLQIKANPVTVKKLPIGINYQRVSLEDYLEFEKEEAEEEKGVRELESQYEAEHNAALTKWEESAPAKKEGKKEEKNSNSFPTIDMHQLTRPSPKMISRPLGGKKGNLGILICNYEDTECLTAMHTSATVTYQPPGATMNYSVLKTTTDIKEGDLTRIMDQLKEKYGVEISHKDGMMVRGSHNGVNLHLPAPVKSKEYQNNIFSLPLTAEMSQDEMMGAIRNVYQAGEAFKAGYNILSEERDIRIKHEENVEERRQDSVLGKF